MMEKRKIFVTGGAGFIGSHLCRKLLDAGHSVTALDNLLLGKEEFLAACKESPDFRFIKEDLRRPDSVEGAIKGHDAVFHMAANSDISGGENGAHVDFELGTFATFNLLEAMRKASIRELIFPSTSAVYGEAVLKPTPEDYGPLLPISHYGASKLACEGLCTAFSHNSGISVWIYRFANIVGGRTTHGAIHDFIRKLRKDPARLRVLGDGTQRKSYLHVDECVDGMLFGWKRSKDPVQVFNLASEGVTTVKFIAEEVVRRMGGKARIEFGEGDRGWRGDVPYTWLDGSRLTGLGWKARWPSDESVRRAVKECVAEA